MELQPYPSECLLFRIHITICRSRASSMRVVLGDHNKEQQQPSEKEFRLNRIIMVN